MDFGDAISELETFVWNLWDLWQATICLRLDETLPNVVNLLRGCRTGASFIPVWHCDSYRVASYIKGWDLILLLHEGTLHGGWRDCDAILDWMSKTTHALPVPVSWESDFMPERTVVLHLNDIGMSFCSGMQKTFSRTLTGMNSHLYGSLWYEILCLYHVNEYRASRRSRSELVPASF